MRNSMQYESLLHHALQAPGWPFDCAKPISCHMILRLGVPAGYMQPPTILEIEPMLPPGYKGKRFPIEGTATPRWRKAAFRRRLARANSNRSWHHRTFLVRMKGQRRHVAA